VPPSHHRLTVKLRGRPEAPLKRRGHTLSSSAHGADTQTVHGPLQRLLGANGVLEGNDRLHKLLWWQVAMRLDVVRHEFRRNINQVAGAGHPKFSGAHSKFFSSSGGTEFAFMETHGSRGAHRYKHRR